MQLEIFNNGDKEIRVVMNETTGEPLWVAKDICDVLDYQNVSKTLQKLDDDEKLIYKIVTSGQKRDMQCINESGLYTLILHSNKPEAKKFKKWVTSEVLPAIRKKGIYSLQKNNFESIENKLFESVEKIKNVNSNNFTAFEKKMLSYMVEQKMTIDYLDQKVGEMLSKTYGLASFYKEIKNLPSFEKYTQSHDRIYSEIENIKRLICYENPALYKKEINMYTEDIELLISVYTLLSSDKNEKMKVRIQI